jgi:hypothetical protein
MATGVGPLWLSLATVQPCPCLLSKSLWYYPRSVTSEGTLLEYETLELRIHPPNVVVDNETYDDMTVITIDSANRPGTLIEVYTLHCACCMRGHLYDEGWGKTLSPVPDHRSCSASRSWASAFAAPASHPTAAGSWMVSLAAEPLATCAPGITGCRCTVATFRDGAPQSSS